MKFPYGISNFETLLKEHYFYVDCTGRLPLLEDAGKQFLFLRPRRFGKSLLLSMLENYYDLAKARRLEFAEQTPTYGLQPTRAGPFTDWKPIIIL